MQMVRLSAEPVLMLRDPAGATVSDPTDADLTAAVDALLDAADRRLTLSRRPGELFEVRSDRSARLVIREDVFEKVALGDADLRAAVRAYADDRIDDIVAALR